jgi:hypothetical protein
MDDPLVNSLGGETVPAAQSFWDYMPNKIKRPSEVLLTPEGQAPSLLLAGISEPLYQQTETGGKYNDTPHPLLFAATLVALGIAGSLLVSKLIN